MAKLLSVDGKLVKTADGKLLTPPEVIRDLTRVALIYDRTTNTIQLSGIAQTYEQIKTLVETTSNDVLLYDTEGEMILQPVASDGAGMLEFTATYLYEGEVHIVRIAINSENVVNYKSEQLALEDEIDVNKEYVDTELAKKQDTLTAGDSISIDNNVVSYTGDDEIDVYSGAYTGVDLSVKFADEIANFSDVWAWLQDRINNSNFKGLKVHDYITLTLTNNEVFQMEIGGINTYLNACDIEETKPHIDLISKALWTVGCQWNKANYNNGITFTFTGDGSTKTFDLTSELNSRGATNYPHLIDTIQYTGGGSSKTLRNNSGYTYDNTTGIITIASSQVAPDSGTAVYIGIANPVLCSNIYAQINALKTCVPNGTTVNPALVDVDYSSTGLYALLPDVVKPYIKTKPMNEPTRWTTTAIRTNADNQYAYAYPRLWLLEEMEVYGFYANATGLYDRWFAKQYPCFIGNTRVKSNGIDGGRGNWWLSSVVSNVSVFSCYIGVNGTTGLYGSPTSSLRTPLCFRMKGE